MMSGQFLSHSCHVSENFDAKTDLYERPQEDGMKTIRLENGDQLSG